jgi:hypothetical protein
VLGEESVRY